MYWYSVEVSVSSQRKAEKAAIPVLEVRGGVRIGTEYMQYGVGPSINWYSALFTFILILHYVYYNIFLFLKIWFCLVIQGHSQKETNHASHSTSSVPFFCPAVCPKPRPGSITLVDCRFLGRLLWRVFRSVLGADRKTDPTSMCRLPSSISPSLRCHCLSGD